uniref:DUF223 domain-containing protein n=1 Tax=Brassica oleracea var. oleracea TaxID=109376 RepID=A0A0D3BT39_BRAOL
MYKITKHPFVIRFIPQTTIDEVIENALIINLEKFMLRKFDPFQALANTNLELPVVVGQFQFVQSLDLKDATVTGQVVVCFVIEPVVVYLSLWDDTGAMFRGLFNSGERAESAMVVTTVNPKIFGGNLYLNSTPATKFYFDLVLHAITEFTASLEGPVGDVFPCIDTKDEEIKKKEVVSIGDLNNRELDKSWTSLYCNRCVNPNVTEVIKEMLKLTKQDAAALTLDEIFNTNEAPFVQEEGGEPSASVTYKVRGKANETYLSGVEGKEGGRKRPRN